MAKWQNVEEMVIDLASIKFEAPGRPETIAGMKIDCVIRKEHDYFVLIETTLEDKLAKVRKDIAKLIAARNSLRSKDVYSKCLIIINGNVTESMIQTCEENKIQITTLDDFENSFLPYERYKSLRNRYSFGSCIDIDTGDAEHNTYIKVKYIVQKLTPDGLLEDKNEIFIDEIIEYLFKNQNIVLLGEYGSGKSRCYKELFSLLGEMACNRKYYPFAINLRDCHGLKNHSEILRRHLEDIGLNPASDNLLKVWDKENFCYLLDGFDEISSQTWSDKPEVVREIRFRALMGVRELISRAKGGILISGREHYFSSTKELLEALNLNPSNTVVIRCKDEFDEDEIADFISTLQLEIEIPEWLPRRPLICNMLAKFTTDERTALVSQAVNDVSFWHLFFDTVAKRESAMAQVFTPDSIQKILIRLSRFTRNKPANVGPITLSEIKKAFEAVLGEYPIDEASVLLQRLVGLGRYESESDNRKFADTYLLDGLRALDICIIIHDDDKIAILQDRWFNPLRNLGVKILAAEIDNHDELLKKSFRYLSQSTTDHNGIFLGDVFTGYVRILPDFRANNITIYDAHLAELDLSDSCPSGVTFKDTIIEELHIGAKSVTNFVLSNCTIGIIYGASSPQSLPGWIENSSVETFHSFKNISAIKDIKLEDRHKVLLTIIHKTFFQKGAARKEEALLRGLGSHARNANPKKIIQLLVSENILTRAKGEEGFIYKPNRKYAARMIELMQQRSSSKDPLWSKV